MIQKMSVQVRAGALVAFVGVLVAVASSCSTMPSTEETENQSSAIVTCGTPHSLVAAANDPSHTVLAGTAAVYIPDSLAFAGAWSATATILGYIVFNGSVTCTYGGSIAPASTVSLPLVSCTGSVGGGASVATTTLELYGTLAGASGGGNFTATIGKSPADTNECTVDTCPAGSPVHTAAIDGVSCETDNNVCNGISTCQSGTCTAGTALAYDDHSLCTTDSCDPQAGVQNIPNGTCAPSTTPTAYPGSGTIPSDFAAGATFVATQNGASASYDSWRVAIVRGRVTDSSGAALAGVSVSVRGYSSFGTATTTANGIYDIEVNGGETYTLSFTKATYLSAIRTVKPRWLDFTVVDDVALVTPVSALSVTPNSGAWQRKVFPSSSDVDGARQPVVLIPPSTTIASGSAPSPWNLRVTEFTAFGQNAMPADLPAQSAYTYAADFSIDGASQPLTFNQPVIVYLENFTNNPLSLSPALQTVDRNIVPVGSLNPTTGKWDADPSLDPTGRVIQIKSITGLLADLSFDGINPMNYAELGITTGERAELAAQYPTGLPKNVWRIPLKHFCEKDFNWPGDTPDQSVPPPPKHPETTQPVGQSCKIKGSVIECENQTLGESLPIPHTPFSLMYRSVTQNGWHPVLKVQITDDRDLATLAPSLQRIETEITVAGLKHEFTTTNISTKNQYVTWAWDRLDAYQRRVQGATIASVKVAYVYPSKSSQVGNFGAYGSGGNNGTRNARERKIYRYYEFPIGAIDAQPLGLGGWMLDVQHLYEPRTGVAWWGHGDQRNPSENGDLLSLYSPAGTYEFVRQLSARPEGGFLAAQARTVVKYDVAGATTPLGVAQPESLSYFQDSPPADGTSFTTLRFGKTFGVAATPDDGFYVSEGVSGLDLPFRVWKVGTAASNRPMTLVAGRRDSAGFSTPDCLAVTADGASATNNMFRPGALATGRDGSLFFVDRLPTSSNCTGTGGRIIRVSPSGRADVVAGNGSLAQPPALPSSPCLTALPVPSASCGAKNQPLGAISGLAVADDGSVYFSDSRGSGPTAMQVWRVTPDGLLSHVAGCLPTVSCTGDGGPAQTLALGSISATLAAKGADLYVFDNNAGSKTVYLLDTSGAARRVAGGGANSYSPAVPAAVAQLNASQSAHAVMTIGSDGTAVGSDGSKLFQFKTYADVGDPLVVGSKLIPMGDGSLASFFPTGRLDRTYSAERGRTRLVYGYDSQGRLTTISDATASSHPTTTIEYVSSTSVLIHPPFDSTTTGAGTQTTALTLAGGYLQTFAKPGGSHVDVVMGGTGLLTQLTDENSNVHTFQYSTDGLLTVDKNPLGATSGTRLARTATPDAWTVSITSPAGRVASHTVDRSIVSSDPQRIERRRHVTEAGTVIDDDTYRDGTEKTTYPAIPSQTSLVTLLSTVDPRYGLAGAFTGSYSVTNGSAQYAATNTRAITPTNFTNAFSFATQTDIYTYTASSAPTMTATEVLDVSAGTSTISTSLNRQIVETLDAYDRAVRVEIKGNVPGQSSPLTYTDLRYDTAGRLDRVSQGARSVTATFDGTSGNLASVATPLGTVTYGSFDSIGRPHSITEPGGRVTLINFDGAGNITQVTTPRGYAHTFTPNGVDDLAAYQPPTSSPTGNTVYGYDSDSLLTSINKLQTGVATYDRDSAGRLKTVAFPTFATSSESVAYTYDEASHVKTVTSLSGTLTYTYDGDRVTKEVYSGGGSGVISYSVEKSYDPFGRLKSRKIVDQTALDGGTTSGSQATLTYDADGQISQVDGTVSQSSYIIQRPTGSPSSNLISGTTLGNISDLYEYDTFGALIHYKAWTGSTILFEVTYTRDSAGRVSDKVEKLTPIGGSLSTCSAHYDYYPTSVTSANWLKEQSVGPGGFASCPGNGNWSYDADGNRALGSSTFDQQDRMTNDQNWTYSYNADGDVTLAAWTTFPSYNFAYARDLHGALRRLTPSVAVGAPTMNYDVDGFGRRLRNRNGTTYQQGYFWDGDRVVAMEKPPWGIVAAFVYVTKPNVPDYILIPASPSWKAYRIISDELGSVRMVVDAGGTTSLEWHTYDAWGVPQGSPWSGGTQFGYQPFGFAGGLWDGTAGLYRFGARDYNPVSGRWWSKDPSRFGGGANLYAYAFNDPVNFVDPQGRTALGTGLGAIGGCVLGGIVGADLGAGAGLVGLGVPTAGAGAVPGLALGAIVGGGIGCGVGGTAGAIVGDWASDELAGPTSTCSGSKDKTKPKRKRKPGCDCVCFNPGVKGEPPPSGGYSSSRYPSASACAAACASVGFSGSSCK